MKNLVKKVMAVITTAVMALSLFSVSAFADEPVMPTQVDTVTSFDVTYSFELTPDHKSKELAPKIEVYNGGSYRVTFDGAHGGGGVTVTFHNDDTNYSYNLSIPAYVSGMPSPITSYVELTQGKYTISASTTVKATIQAGFKIYGVNGVLD